VRIFAEVDDGSTVVLGELSEVTKDSGALILMCKSYLMNEDKSRICESVTKTTGKPCVILDPYIVKVLGV